MGGVNQGELFVRIKPHEERVFGFGRIWHETKNLTPWRAFYGNYSQRDVMQEIRRPAAQVPAPALVRPQHHLLQHRGRPHRDRRSPCAGPDIVTLVRSIEKLRDLTQSGEIPGVVDGDVGLQLDKPELRIHVDRDRAADLGVDTTDVATSLRIMVGGDDRVSRYLRPHDQRGLRRPAPAGQAVPQRPRHHLAPLRARPRPAASCASTTSCSIEEGQAPSRIERLDRQRTVRFFAGVGPGYALGDRAGRPAQGPRPT